jgi:hypothetical protein
MRYDSSQDEYQMEFNHGMKLNRIDVLGRKYSELRIYAKGGFWGLQNGRFVEQSNVFFLPKGHGTGDSSQFSILPGKCWFYGPGAPSHRKQYPALTDGCQRARRICGVPTCASTPAQTVTNCKRYSRARGAHFTIARRSGLLSARTWALTSFSNFLGPAAFGRVHHG